MASLTALVIAVIVAISTLFFRKVLPKKKRGGVPVPPKNTVADVARENIQQTFAEEVERIDEAQKGDDPATALADLGNARKRR